MTRRFTLHPSRFSVHAVLFTASLIAACSKEPPPPPPAPAGVQTRELSYQGDVPLKGFVAWDAGRTDKRPGVLVVHEWWGQNEHARNQARRLADAGYVGFALDMYGNGQWTAHPDTAQTFMNAALKDIPALLTRFNAALAQLKADPHVDSTKIAAIGYCFGGAVVLMEARAGAPLAAVGSFHGAMPPEAKVDSGTVRARILIMTGGQDPMVPAKAVEAYAAALKKAGATVEVITYPDAMHSFTNPRADSVGMAGLKYNAEADRQSWDSLLTMLREVFGS